MLYTPLPYGLLHRLTETGGEIGKGRGEQARSWTALSRQ